MYRILVPVDSDVDRAERQADFLAGLPIPADSMEIVLAHALAESNRSRERGDTEISILDAIFQWPPVKEGAQNQRSTARDGSDSSPDRDPNVDRISSVRKIARRLDEAGHEIRIEEIQKPVDTGIVDLAERIEADQIVMGGRKRSPAGKVVFGSTTHAVMTSTDVPLTVTGG